MLNFNDVSLKQTRFYQDVFSEGREEGRMEGRTEGHMEGRMEGRVEGRMEGRAAGRAEGEAALLMRLLERKFGNPLTDSIRQRIASADAETLLIWGERVLDANGVEDVFGH